MNNRYIGITFGPIDRVLSWSKSTMSIWASSYFFSDLARQIIQPLLTYTHKDDNGEKVTVERKFLKPVITEEMKDPEQGVVGLFPDQYIFEALEGDSIASAREHCDKVFDRVGNKMAKALKEPLSEEKIQKYLKQTIKVYIVELNAEEGTAEADIISKMHTLMANAECRDIFPSRFDGQEGGYLERLFCLEVVPSKPGENVNKWKWLAEYFGVKLESFDSIPEVAYKSYVTFVSADGDHFGEMVSRDKKASLIISNFSKWMRKIISVYGGQVIYQGGDDISFYAPLIGNDSEAAIIDQEDSRERTYKKNGQAIDIFGLTQRIDMALKDAYEAEIKIDSSLEESLKDCIPSISYGIAMAYERHPMAETRHKAESLMYRAKDAGRNAICWELRKHSGHTSFATINKGKTELYEATIKLINTALSDISKEKNSEEFLHSVTYFLSRHEEILCYILSQSMMLSPYFDGNFNEEEHGRKSEFLNQVQDVLQKAYASSMARIPEDESDMEEYEKKYTGKENKVARAKDALAYLHATLRYIHHLFKK